jgi:hypothetical protein
MLVFADVTAVVVCRSQVKRRTSMATAGQPGYWNDVIGLALGSVPVLTYRPVRTARSSILYG